MIDFSFANIFVAKFFGKLLEIIPFTLKSSQLFGTER